MRSIVICGTGGQGILTFARILADSLLDSGFDVKQTEIHGMSQRGGVVTSHVRYGDKIHSPIICEGEADVIIAFERTEARRAEPLLKKGGMLILLDRCILTSEGKCADLSGAYEGATKHVFLPERLMQDAPAAPKENSVMLGIVCQLLSLEPRHIKESLKKLREPQENIASFQHGLRISS